MQQTPPIATKAKMNLDIPLWQCKLAKLDNQVLFKRSYLFFVPRSLLESLMETLS